MNLEDRLNVVYNLRHDGVCFVQFIGDDSNPWTGNVYSAMKVNSNEYYHVGEYNGLQKYKKYNT